jgi:hypothetical protein
MFRIPIIRGFVRSINLPRRFRLCLDEKNVSLKLFKTIGRLYATNVVNVDKLIMSFIVIEGIDGSGKSTQLKKTLEFLGRQRVRFKYIHFPRTDSPVYGDLIARFLRGDLGDLKSVNPYLVALIYAGDRYDARIQISEWLNEGFLVVADRYVYSNVAFQCAK